jgi:voltage-gated potassium channel
MDDAGLSPHHPFQSAIDRPWFETRDERSIHMTTEAPKLRKTSNAYNIFILVLTVFSLAVMVVMLLPSISEATMKLLTVYDNLICFIFLLDFYLNMRGAAKKSDYFIKERGWLDLLGSIPSLGLLTNAGKYAGLLRLARLSRLARIARLLRGENRKTLIKDILENRSRYAAFLTILLTIIVLTVSSVLVLQFESKSPDANIKTGGDALWYAVVTITTVGYGDRYPVTAAGRITAVFIMFMGVGIIGALASILASVLVGGAPAEEEETPAAAPAPTVEQELGAIKDELAVMHQMLEKLGGGDGRK